MTRYIAKPSRAWLGDDVLETSHELNDSADYSRSVTVFEADKAPVETGLVDHRGVALYRVEDDVKLGFHTGNRK